jgi:hypothetical protein
MQADNSQYVKALDQATQKLSKFAKDQDDLLSGLADKFAAALSVGALTEFAASSIESAASLARLSQSAGVSVESLSSLRLAAAASGLSQDDLATSLKKLDQAISQAGGNATSKAGEAFRALGIDLASIKNASPDQVLGQVADKFKDLADGPNKTAIAIQLFGRAGQQMIPVLNQGAAGLDNFKAQAEAAGIVISGPLADAAEQFSQKFEVIKATLSSGFGNQLAAQLLPVLSTLADQLTASTSTGQAFAEVAGLIVGGVKLVAAGVIEVISEFKQFGDSIGALGAIAVAVAHGNFSQATAIWKESNADNVATAKSSQAQIQAVFEAGTAAQLSEISTAEAQKKRILSSGVSLESVAESDQAIKELQSFNANLKDQSGAFGLGSAALVNYKLQFGPLADAIAKAGDEGKKLAAEIRANALALQTKEDTKQITDFTDKLQEQVTKFEIGDVAAIKYQETTGKLGEALSRSADGGAAASEKINELAISLTKAKDTNALFSVDQQLQTLQGHLVQAAAAAFDFQNKLLSKNLADTGDTGGQAQLAQLKAATEAQAAFNEEVEKASIIEQQYATVEAKVNAAVAQGALTDLQAQAQLEGARTTEIAQLDQVYAAQKKIADDSGLPKLKQQAQDFDNQIVNLTKDTNTLTNQVRNNLESAFADNFSKLISGGESFQKFLKSFFKDIENQIDQMVSKNVAQSIFGTGGPGGGVAGGISSLFGGSSSGAGGAGIFGSLFGLFGGGSGAAGLGPVGDLVQNGGAGGGVGNLVDTIGIDGLAGGGTIPAGGMALVGENGPELAYAGAKDTQIVPNGAFGNGSNITNNFTVQAPGGTISRSSQMQTAAAAARALSQANMRNNGG